MNDSGSFQDLCRELTALRRDLHANPELGFREERTAALVAERLKAFGLAVDQGLAATGVVGTLRRGEGGSIGLRADMDALPMDECSGAGHASRRSGVMHACGHDGHTAMLLGAAAWLAEHGGFSGTVHFIFQPAEESLAGGKRMVDEGLFDRFPMDAVFGLHNLPGHPAGHLGMRAGPVMAAADFFELRIIGTGGHAAYPHRTRDPIVAAAAIINAWQTLVSRGSDPLAAAVLSVTQIHGGTTDNVIPERVTLTGTVRSFSETVQDAIEQGMRRMADGIAAAHGVAAELSYDRRYRATVNHPEPAALAVKAMEQAVGPECIIRDLPSTMGAEDFGWMLAACPGAYAVLGNGTDGPHGRPLHNPGYDFNDAVIGAGVRYWVALVQRALPAAS